MVAVAVAIIAVAVVLFAICCLKGKWKLGLLALLIYFLATIGLANQREQRNETDREPSYLPEIIALVMLGAGAVKPAKAGSWWERRYPRPAETEAVEAEAGE